MIPREKDFGAVILAGGQSRRMGRCKALLTVDGQTLLARTAQQLTAFSELLLSANDPALARAGCRPALCGTIIQTAAPWRGWRRP